MATINSINSNIPIEISKGGTNATSMTTSYGTLYYDGSSIVTVASVGTSGQALTSNGAGVAPTFQDQTGSTGTISAAFYAYKSADSTNVTGDGTVYTIINNTELSDVGADYNTSTGIFTAPSTTKYFLSAVTQEYNGGTETENISSIVTSNRNYKLVTGRITNIKANLSPEGNPASVGRNVLTLADMDASDTAYVTIQGSGGTKITHTGNDLNEFSGSEVL